MSVITKKGKDVKQSVNEKKVDLKKAYIRLKDGESVRVRLLGVEDYAEYLAHGSYNLGIYTQPCTLPAGQRCAYDEVVNIVRDLPENHELKKFEELYPKKRYIFAFADIDSGEIRFFDASKGQAKQLIENIEEYADDINEVCFNFKRVGEKTETKYSLNPILKLKGDDLEKFKRFDGQIVEPEMYDAVLVPRTFEQQLEALKNAGFPVEKYFGDTEQEENKEIQEKDLPF